MNVDLIPKLTVLPAGPRKPVDISIIIAHRGSDLGLWATIESCEIDLAGTSLTREYVIHVNGMDKLTDEMIQIRQKFGKAKKLGDMLHTVQPLSPPTARQLATEVAVGEYLFFFDNHCLPNRDYFTRAIASMEKYNIDLLHSYARFWDGCDDIYDYELALKRDFWSRSPYTAPLNSDEPYKVALGPHGGFVVKRSTWKEMGGYWMGFEGYGGEESYLNFKFWMMGKTCWLDPKMMHYHWAGPRGYDRHFTDDFFRNMMMSAHIIGGPEWLRTLYNSFSKSPRLAPDLGTEVVPMYDLYMQAYEKSREHAEWMAEHRQTTLDGLLKWFANNNIRV